MRAPLSQFLDEVAAETRTPGGGAAAGVALAIAAGLLAMAARFSRTEWEDAPGIVAQAEALRDRVAALAAENDAAYAAASRALAGETSARGRDAGIAVALSGAVAVLLQIAEAASDVAELGAVVVDCGHPAFRADAVSATLLAEASARIAANLVEINLGVTPEDERLERVRSLAELTSRASARARASAE
jgi:formiminotetrahydrofolate cyclodeaminase